MNQIDLNKRVAIVTGGAQGIGLAIVKRMLASGASVRIWDRDQKLLQQTLSALTGPVSGDAVDVADENSVAQGTAAAAALGKIDILVNNAGIAGATTPVIDYPVEEWERVLKIDLTGPFLCARAVAPHMVRQKYGRIVNIASISGKEGNPNASAYSAAKAGDRAHQVARQRTREGRRDGQLRDAGSGEDGDLRPDIAAAHRLHAVQDPDGPFRPGRGNRGHGVLARIGRLLLHHRRRVRHLRRPRHLLISDRATRLEFSTRI